MFRCQPTTLEAHKSAFSLLLHNVLVKLQKVSTFFASELKFTSRNKSISMAPSGWIKRNMRLFALGKCIAVINDIISMEMSILLHIVASGKSYQIRIKTKWIQVRNLGIMCAMHAYRCAHNLSISCIDYRNLIQLRLWKWYLQIDNDARMFRVA